ncbi:unnamed protein product [Moneuplotes crassus]|uniref:Protein DETOXIFICATION n=1 Tax=Euplotes crassus TaxID=5936 RepID=A0AAD1UA78_EUPCR|nr:unnamed protein product [Moneuplotes crassus]
MSDQEQTHKDNALKKSVECESFSIEESHGSQESLLFEKSMMAFKDQKIPLMGSLKEILFASIPSMFGLVFQVLTEVSNLVFVGQYGGAKDLSGVGLGNMLVNIIIFSIGMGMNGALDTLVSQSHGNKQYYLCGVYLNRARIIQAILFVPGAILLLFTKQILILFQQEEEASEIARLYVCAMIPGLFAMTQFETLRRYLQGMEIFHITMIIQCSTMVLHFLWTYLLFVVLDMGILGVSIATLITFWLNLLSATLLLTYKKGIVHEQSWSFFNKDSFAGWGQYIRYGIPATCMLCLEWWAFEVLEIFAGMVSVDVLAAHVIFQNFLYFLFQIPFGIGFASANLIGNCLGDCNPSKARKYFHSALLLIFMITTVIDILIFTFRSSLSRIYTQEDSVNIIVRDTTPVVVVMVMLDFPQGVLAGVLRGIGSQDFGSFVTLVGYWIFSLPGAVILTFVFDLQLKGIWGGIQIGTLVCFSSFLYRCLTANWTQLSKDAVKRIHDEKLKLIEGTNSK